ncbi:organic cation/carnitine transporter 3-like [Rosa sericea]
MGDSTPLLSESNSAESEPLLLQKHLPSLDSTIELCIGDFGWAQFLQAILVSFSWFFDAQQTFITVFTDAEPAWHCTQQLTDNPSSCNSSFSNICQLSKSSWDWDRPKHTSVISEWALECSGSVVTGLPASSFFMGCLIGGLALSTLADSSLGRKKMLFLSCLMMSFTTLLTAFSTNIWIYSFLRFVTGFARATIGTSALVLSTELVGKRWRGQVGVIGFFCFTLGFLSLPAIAYTHQSHSWRTLYFWTSIPTLFYSILVHFLVRESPRWLFVRGRKEDAISTLKCISPASITMNFSSLSFEQETWNVDLYSAIGVLVKRKWAFRRLCAVMGTGFGIGMVYYGMPLALGSLNFNLYLSVTLNALSELPASLVAFFLIGKLNRRSSLLVFTFLSGACSILSVLKGFNPWAALQIGLELVSFFSACSAFNVLLIFTIELFPTCVRNSALSMVRQAVVLGGVFSPMLAAAGRANGGVLSYGVFGVVVGVCGLFVVCLPETRGRRICDTMDEEEHKETANCNAVPLVV